MHMVAVTAATFAAAGVVFAQDIVDGITPATGVTGMLIAVGALVFRHLWSAFRADHDAVTAQRRRDDDLRVAEIERLQARIDELTDLLLQERKHRDE